MTDGSDYVKCPLCLGRGRLLRLEMFERLGMKDIARVAQLSAEEAMRLLKQEHADQQNSLWVRFETELARPLGEISSRHNDELHSALSAKGTVELKLRELQSSQAVVVENAKAQERFETERKVHTEMQVLHRKISDLEAFKKVFEEGKNAELARVRNQLQEQINSKESTAADLNRKVSDYLHEILDLRARNQSLENEIWKITKRGIKEEVEFADDARSWPGIWISEKLVRAGDYLIAYRDLHGQPLEPKMLIDNKDKRNISEDDVEKLVRDAKSWEIRVAALVAKDETQLRSSDKDARWASRDGIWVLRTTRQWLRRDLDILKPLFDLMRAGGPDSLAKNVKLAEEIKHTLTDIDQIETELRKASKSIQVAKDLAHSYKVRLQLLCDLPAEARTVVEGSPLFAEAL